MFHSYRTVALKSYKSIGAHWYAHTISVVRFRTPWKSHSRSIIIHILCARCPGVMWRLYVNCFRDDVETTYLPAPASETARVSTVHLQRSPEWRSSAEEDFIQFNENVYRYIIIISLWCVWLYICFSRNGGFATPTVSRIHAYL